MVDSYVDRARHAFRAGDRGYSASHSLQAIRVVAGVAEVTPVADAASGATRPQTLALETTNVWRGETLLAGAAEATSLRDTGGVEVKRGELREHFDNTVEGLMQSWHFAAAPSGEGDLVVEVAVSGQRFVRSTDSGLHFASKGSLGVRYSHGIWIDAAGKELAVPAMYEDGRILLSVPHEVLEASTYPAFLDPTVTPEIDVDVPVNGRTGAASRNASVAFDGSQYLVVWADNRDSGDSDIWGTRLTASGTVLDTAGIRINNAAGVQSRPQAIWTGTTFLVVWEHFASATNSNIVGATVSGAGAVAQIGNIVATAANETTPQLASRGGNNTLVVWRSDDNVRGSIYSGSVGAAFDIAATVSVEKEPAVAANPAGEYLVTFTDGVTGGENLRGQRVTSAGAVSGAAFDISVASGVQSLSTVGFDGTNFVVVFQNNFQGLNLYGTRVSTAGVVLDTRTEGMATVGGIPVINAADNQETPRLACGTEQSCVLTWQERRNLATTGFDVYGAVLTSTAALAAGTEFVVSNAVRGQSQNAIVRSGSNYLAAWTDFRDGGADTITVARVGATGTVTDTNGIPVVRGNNREISPAIAISTTNILTTWSDSRNDSGDIVGVRFNSNGSKIDSVARPVAIATGTQSTPAVAFGSNVFMNVWSDLRGASADIFAARVTSIDGALQDPGGIAISTAAGNQLVPKVASDGTNFLVVWQDGRNSPTGFDIFGALIGPTGAVIANDISICTFNGNQTRPAVAYDATASQYIVAWGDGRTADGDVFAARVSSAGAVLDGACGVQVTTQLGSQSAPAIAFASGRSLIAWEDRRNDGNGDIFGTRVRGGASLIIEDPSGINIASSPGEQNQVTVANLGSGGAFLVAWTDGRTFGSSNYDIYAATVRQTGTLENPPFVVSAAPQAETAPALSGGSSVARLAYQKARPDLNTTRVETRRIESSATAGQPCTTGATCETGNCVDGVCCDTACGGANITDCQACSAARGATTNGTCTILGTAQMCRNYAPNNVFCDAREYCNGVDPTCPPDIGRNEGRVCNAGTGAVCPSNAPPGPHICPT